MRWPRHKLARLLLELTALAALVAAGWFALERALPAFVRGPIETELAANGFPEARFLIASVGWTHIRLTDLYLAPDLSVGAVDLVTDASGLVGGNITSVALERARWTTRLDEEALAESSLGRVVARMEGEGPSDTPPPRVRIASSRIVIQRESGSFPIDVDGDLVLAESRGALTLRSELGEHALSIGAHEQDDTQRIELSLRALDETETLDVSVHRATRPDAPFTWHVVARLPAERLEQLAPALELGGIAQLEASGITRHRDDDDVWTLEDVTLTAMLDEFRAPSAEIELRRSAATLHLEGTLGPSADAPHDLALQLELAETSRIEHGVARLGDWHAEELELAPHARVELAAGGLRVHGIEPIAVRSGTLAVGTDPGSLVLQRPEVTLTAREGRPMVSVERGATHLDFAIDGTAPRLVGALRGRRVQARGTLEAELGATPERLDVPLRIHVARVIEPESELSLDRARIDLTVAHDRHGDVVANGRVRARTISYGEHALGATAGSMRIADDRLALDWRSPAFRLTASLGLERGDGHADVHVPWSLLRESDPLHRVLADVTGFAITGRAAGELHVDVRRPGRSRAEISLHEAAVERIGAGSRATGVNGTLHLATLDPVESKTADAIRWNELVLDDTITLGRGRALVRIEPSGEVSVSEMVAALGGGRLHAAPLRFDPEAPDVWLDLTFEAVELRRVVDAIAGGHATGSGRLDGRIGMRVALGEEPRVVLGTGSFASRGGGRIQVDGESPAAARPLQLEQLGNSDWARDRLLAALRDFQYSRLVLDVVSEGAGEEEGTKRVVARVSGRGARIPQALDMTLNVRGVQPVVDELLRTWRRTSVVNP